MNKRIYLSKGNINSTLHTTYSKTMYKLKSISRRAIIASLALFGLFAIYGNDTYENVPLRNLEEKEVADETKEESPVEPVIIEKNETYPIHVDRIYYINMDHRTDKRDWMESWLEPFSKKYSVPYYRISGKSGDINDCPPHLKDAACIGMTGVGGLVMHWNGWR